MRAFLRRYIHRNNSRKGVTLLIVVVIITALFSVGLGIFDVIYGQFRLSGDLNNSFISLFAADQGIERTLYRERNPMIGPLPSGTMETRTTEANGCFKMTITKSMGSVILQSTGQNTPCGVVGTQTVIRALKINYPDYPGFYPAFFPG